MSEPPKPRRAYSFRGILLAVILGLILASSLSTTWFGAMGLGSAIRALLDRQIKTTLDAVTGRVEELFLPTERLLKTLGKRIRDGELPTSDPLEVARTFAEALEFESGITWIYFGYADGRFAGALMQDGRIILNVSSPGESWQDWIRNSDGKLERFDSGRPAVIFDARERIWFQLADKHEGIVWTPPYDYVGGHGRGISVSEAVRAPDGSLIGVVAVDFLLEDITRYLEHLKNEFRGDTLVFSIRGQLLASPKDSHNDPIIAKIQERLEGDEAYDKIQNKGGHLIMEFSTSDDTFIAGVRRAAVPGDLDCMSAIIFSRNEVFGALEQTIRHGIFTALVALAASLVAGYFLAARIATPLRALAKDVARIARFDLGPRPDLRSDIREIRALSDSIEIMRTGLQSFSHYVPVDLVRDLMHSGGIAGLGGERREIAIMFCDLVGFTSHAENIPPEEAVKILTSYFEDFGGAIHSADGVIDKFLGDGIMALFNAPERILLPAACACRASLRGIAAMRARQSLFDVRVGLHFGPCLVGNVGTADRFTYTAIGDSVNLTSRLEGLNKHYSTRIIASTALREAAGEDEFLWRRLDRVAVAGRAAPLDIHELMGFRADADPAAAAIAGNYPSALAAFLDQDFPRALEFLAAIPAADDPSRLLRERIEHQIADPGGHKQVNAFAEK